MRRVVDVFGRKGGHRQLINKRKSCAVIVLLVCTISLFSTFSPSSVIKDPLEEFCGTVLIGGWIPSSAPPADWPPPPNESNGYLRVRCVGGMMKQRIAICDAVLVARIMNATLVLPDDFQSIYDVEHFIKSLRYDVRIVESLPEILTHGEMKRMEAYRIFVPSNASLIWYTKVALEKMKEHGAIYIPSFYLEEEITNHEFQRLRCRVNFHALQFKPQVLKLSDMIVSKLRSQGQFLAIDLRFEMDLVSMCYDIFTPEEQAELLKYLDFRAIQLHRSPMEYRALGECPLTPEEVGFILRAMRFNSSTRIYLVAGEMFGGERYLKPFRALFPHLENHSTVVPANEELAEKNTLRISAVDYMVCLQADIFMPTYFQHRYEFNDEKSYFTNIVMGQRLYHGCRTTIQTDRKALGPIFMDWEMKKRNRTAATAGLEKAVRRVMFSNNKMGGLHYRRPFEESFYTNPMPDCFCHILAQSSSENYCPIESGNFTDIMNNPPIGFRWHSEEEPSDNL